MKKVKVFTTGADPGGNSAGNYLTDLCNKFLESGNYDLIDIHTNSNKYGWMLAITYIERVTHE